jgi:UDP-N-acetylmuramoyl-L-alanyl-D-glutamate--2,6-diaminopimelate ligase
MEDYFLAKLQLFKRPELAFAVINRDDAYSDRIISALSATVALWTFSKQEQTLKNCLVAKNAYCDRTGIGFQACCNGETVQINSALYGEFNIENLLAVLTTLLALGFTLPDAAEKIATLQPVSGRMEHFGGDSQAVVFVDYAHTPDALDKVLAGVKKHNPQQLWVVFGCGGNRDQGKRALMGKIAQQWADKIILTDDNPRYEDGAAIVQAILQGCHSNKVTVIRDRAKAIQTAITQAHKNDCVVIAGKGHESYQKVNGVKTPFSDQEIVKKTLALWTK